MRRLLPLLSACVAALSSATALAAERVAVVMSAENAADAGLAENLAEAAIAKLAESRSGELVGTREITRLLERTHPGKILAACVVSSECLSHLREELAIASIVDGKLRRDGERIVLELDLVDAVTAKQVRRLSRTSDDVVAELVQATQTGVAELFAPIEAKPRVAEASATPPRLALPDATRPAVRTGAILAPVPDAPAERPRWQTTVGYGAGAAALVSISAAAVFGALAQREPSGDTRHEAQAALDRGRTFATTANVLWISSGVLAVTSVLALAFPSRSVAK